MKRALAVVLVLFLAAAAWAGIRLAPSPNGHDYDFTCPAAGSAAQVIFADGTTSYLLSTAPYEDVALCFDTTCDAGRSGRRFPGNTLMILDIYGIDGGYGLACQSGTGDGGVHLTQVIQR